MAQNWFQVVGTNSTMYRFSLCCSTEPALERVDLWKGIHVWTTHVEILR
jgi:hypothetical protein